MCNVSGAAVNNCHTASPAVCNRRSRLMLLGIRRLRHTSFVAFSYTTLQFTCSFYFANTLLLRVVLHAEEVPRAVPLFRRLGSSTPRFFTAFTTELSSCRRYTPSIKFRHELKLTQIKPAWYLGPSSLRARPINCQLTYTITTHSALAWYLGPRSDSLLPLTNPIHPKMEDSWSGRRVMLN